VCYPRFMLNVVDLVVPSGGGDGNGGEILPKLVLLGELCWRG